MLSPDSLSHLPHIYIPILLNITTMQFITFITTLGLAASAATACNPGEYTCGSRKGSHSVIGAVFVCNAVGQWQISAECGGGPNCCARSGAAAYCIC